MRCLDQEPKLFKKIQVPDPEVFTQYPELAEYFQDHKVAFLYQDRVQLSVEEKIERFGGIELLAENVRRVEASHRIMYTVLTACRDGFLTGYQVIRFGEAIGQTGAATGNIFPAAEKLMSTRPPQLERTDQLMVVSKYTSQSGFFDINRSVGWRSLGLGVQVAARLTVSDTQSSLSSTQISNPQVI